jgi:Protein of unknown function (DUF2591)
VKVSELTGALLDYWVARVEGIDPALLAEIQRPDSVVSLKASRPSTDWAHGGPIIERERILVWPCTQANDGNPIRNWTARVECNPNFQYFADTPLIAAMRAYVASKFGDEIPDQSPSEAK